MSISKFNSSLNIRIILTIKTRLMYIYIYIYITPTSEKSRTNAYIWSRTNACASSRALKLCHVPQFGGGGYQVTMKPIEPQGNLSHTKS